MKYPASGKEFIASLKETPLTKIVFAFLGIYCDFDIKGERNRKAINVRFNIKYFFKTRFLKFNASKSMFYLSHLCTGGLLKDTNTASSQKHLLSSHHAREYVMSRNLFSNSSFSRQAQNHQTLLVLYLMFVPA